LTEPVAIIGATGALGFGLAVGWGRAGVRVTIDSHGAELRISINVRRKTHAGIRITGLP
jgi:predicted dinucleotide-binding enzyme